MECLPSIEQLNRQRTASSLNTRSFTLPWFPSDVSPLTYKTAYASKALLTKPIRFPLPGFLQTNCKWQIHTSGPDLLNTPFPKVLNSANDAAYCLSKPTFYIIPPSPCSNTLVDLLSWTCWTQGKEPCKHNWWLKQPAQVACVWDDLKNWGAWDTTCGQTAQAKDTTPPMACGREPGVQTVSGRRGPSSIRPPSIGTVSKATWGKLLRGQGRAPFAIFRSALTYIPWTELNWNELRIVTCC